MVWNSAAPKRKEHIFHRLTFRTADMSATDIRATDASAIRRSARASYGTGRALPNDPAHRLAYIGFFERMEKRRSERA